MMNPSQTCSRSGHDPDGEGLTVAIHALFSWSTTGLISKNNPAATYNMQHACTMTLHAVLPVHAH